MVQDCRREARQPACVQAFGGNSHAGARRGFESDSKDARPCVDCDNRDLYSRCYAEGEVSSREHAPAGLKIAYGAVFQLRAAVFKPLGELTFIETPLATDPENAGELLVLDHAVHRSRSKL